MNVNVEECEDQIEVSTLKNNFDESICLKEITYAIRVLRKNTNVGFDCISNEMIKNSSKICYSVSVNYLILSMNQVFTQLNGQKLYQKAMMKPTKTIIEVYRYQAV